MKKFSLCLLLGCLLQAAQAAPSVAPDEQFKPGRDFRQVTRQVVDSANNLAELQQLADVEIFYWYGCEPCRQAEAALSDYLAAHPQFKVRRTPIVAFPDWRPQAYLQPLMRQLEGKIELPKVDELYQQCLQDCQPFSSFDAIKSWLINRYQLKQLPHLDEPQIWQAQKKSQKRAESFSISQVPTILIREKYLCDANSAGSAERLVKLVDYLLKQHDATMDSTGTTR